MVPSTVLDKTTEQLKHWFGKYGSYLFFFLKFLALPSMPPTPQTHPMIIFSLGLFQGSIPLTPPLLRWSTNNILPAITNGMAISVKGQDENICDLFFWSSFLPLCIHGQCFMHDLSLPFLSQKRFFSSLTKLLSLFFGTPSFWFPHQHRNSLQFHLLPSLTPITLLNMNGALSGYQAWSQVRRVYIWMR